MRKEFIGAAGVAALLATTGDIVMIRKMLRGIKRRSEQLAAQRQHAPLIAAVATPS